MHLNVISQIMLLTMTLIFDLDNFQIDIRPNCLASEYEISYNDEYASDGCIDTYVSGDSEKAFKDLLKEFGIEVEDE